MEAVFTDVCADAEHLPDHGVRDVVAQVDQREQHFLIRIELASGLGSLCGETLCGETPVSEFGQHCGNTAVRSRPRAAGSRPNKARTRFLGNDCNLRLQLTIVIAEG